MTSKEWIVYDAEFDRLENPSILWVACLEDNNGEQFEILGSDPDWINKFETLVSQYPVKVGHNIIGYDNPALAGLGATHLKVEDGVVDTLVLSRLVDYGARNTSHSLEAWGEHFGYPKVKVSIYDDPALLPLYRERCRTDVTINVKVWKHLQKYWDSDKWSLSTGAEMKLAEILRETRDHGFKFDVSRAREMKIEMEEQLEEYYKLMMSIERPFVQPERHPVKKKKDGTLSVNSLKYILLGGGNFTKCGEWIEMSVPEFNPNSHKQRIEVLHHYGWKPTDKSKGHARQAFGSSKEQREYNKVYGWKVNETNLSTLPDDAPEGVKALAQYLTLKGRYDDLVEWLSVVHSDGYIRGNINHIGAWTHRCSHSNPNTGNIFSSFHAPPDKELSAVELIKQEWDEDLRSLWIVEDDEVLMGVDAEGIQLRVLAEYMQDEVYKNAVETGDKKKGTDIHTVNLKALNLSHLVRDDAKTFIYAWVLGSGTEKTSEILKISTSLVPNILKTFLDNLPGLKRVKEEVIPSDWDKGYFKGFDGRFVRIPFERLTLAGYLQNGEKVIMLHWLIEWYTRAKQEGIPFHLVNFVHDEFQIAIKPEFVKRLSEIMKDSLDFAVNDVLGLWVQHAMEVKIGRNWAESH